jgi:peptidyl-dipeptidase A
MASVASFLKYHLKLFVHFLYRNPPFDAFKEAEARFVKMLEMGQSRPWPEALYALTGERQMDATAMLDYFAPLKKWLDEQNQGHREGW